MKLTNNTFSEIGIDSIGFYMPHLMLSHSTLAKSQNIDVNKYNLGLLTYEMRVPNLGEDIVVLGIKAAKNAIMNDPIDSSFIDAVFVGSETITYAVKSISNILKDILGLKHNCLTQDVYNACASGTLALLNSIALIESGVIERALIVAVDISTYPVGSSGESTQGAGAIAMIISKNPRIAVFGKQFGRVSGNINDFFRNAGEFTPEVFGKYSLDSYISMQMEAYNDLIKRMHLSHPIVDHYIFHAPYAKLPLKFMQKLLATQFLQSNEFRKFFLSLDSNLNIENELNPAFDYLDDCFILSSDISEPINNLDEDETIKESLRMKILYFIKKRVLNSLQFPSLVGNMYSAAIWAEFYYLLENSVKENDIIYFGSYGSGATAISGFMKIQQGFNCKPQNKENFRKFMMDKEEITYDKYLSLREGKRESNLKWGKLDHSNITDNRGFSINLCDYGCLLTSYQHLNRCPKEHEGNHCVFFPLKGYLKELKDFVPNDMKPLKDNWVLLNIKEDAIKIGSIVEMEFRRWDPEKGIISVHEPYKGILNWIPIYRNNYNDIKSLSCSVDKQALDKSKGVNFYA